MRENRYSRYIPLQTYPSTEKTWLHYKYRLAPQCWGIFMVLLADEVFFSESWPSSGHSNEYSFKSQVRHVLFVSAVKATWIGSAVSKVFHGFSSGFLSFCWLGFQDFCPGLVHTHLLFTSFTPLGKCDSSNWKRYPGAKVFSRNQSVSLSFFLKHVCSLGKERIHSSFWTFSFWAPHLKQTYFCLLRKQESHEGDVWKDLNICPPSVDALQA